MNSITIQGYGRPNTVVHREGNVLTVEEDNDGRRCGGALCQVTVEEDKISIRNFREHDKDFEITLRDGMLSVMPPDNGMRGGGGGFAVTTDKPIPQHEFQRVGLHVASSLTGFPLFLAPEMPPQGLYS